MTQLLLPQHWQLSVHMKPCEEGGWMLRFRGYEFAVSETEEQKLCFSVSLEHMHKLVWTLSSIIRFEDALHSLVMDLYRELVHSVWHIYVEDRNTLRIEDRSGYLMLTQQDDSVLIFGRIPSCRHVVCGQFVVSFCKLY